MINKNKIYFAAAIIIAVVLTAQSCKKGCTDPTAINYTPGATHENASCLYCDSFVETGESNQTQAIDMNSSSAHFSQIVLLVAVSANQVTYSGNGCQMLGIGTQNGNGCSNITYTASLINQTANTIVVSGNLLVQPGTGGNISYTVSSVSIPAFGSANINIGQAQCSSMSFFSIIFQSPTFQYH